MALVNYRGSLSSVEPFDVYQKYLAMKNHFSNKGGYDYHQYNGKVRANKTSFEVRRDKYFFYKLSKLKNRRVFVSQLCRWRQRILGWECQ